MLMMITFYHPIKTSNSFCCRQTFYYQIKIPIDFLYKQESFDHKRLHQLIGSIIALGGQKLYPVL